jgi:preprotein translocase subunit YajC
MNQASGQIIFFIVIVAVFWLLLIRPQQQRARKHAELVQSVTAGDEIVTIGGIYATVVETGDERVRVRVADGSELEIARAAVSSIVSKAGSGDSSADESISAGKTEAAEKDEHE